MAVGDGDGKCGMVICSKAARGKEVEEGFACAGMQGCVFDIIERKPSSRGRCERWQIGNLKHARYNPPPKTAGEAMATRMTAQMVPACRESGHALYSLFRVWVRCLSRAGWGSSCGLSCFS